MPPIQSLVRPIPPVQPDNLFVCRVPFRSVLLPKSEWSEKAAHKTIQEAAEDLLYLDTYRDAQLDKKPLTASSSEMSSCLALSANGDISKPLTACEDQLSHITSTSDVSTHDSVQNVCVVHVCVVPVYRASKITQFTRTSLSTMPFVARAKK